MTKSSRLWPALALLAAALLTTLLYAPGLGGGYILDDVPNLQPLESLQHGDVSIAERIEFVTSNPSGPAGRPISMLSFALQANAWPDDSAAFKQVNLAIHLASGLAIFLLVRLLLALRGPTGQRAAWIAVAVAALWLVHPLNVSTTLYIVQRMTQLAVLFMVLAMACYLYGRDLLETKDRAIPGLAWMTIGFGGFGLLAVLSKEIGALLPLLVLATEFSLASDRRRSPLMKRWLVVFAIVPAIALPLLILWQLGFDLTGTFRHRDFTVGERLLTQARVVFDYLGKVILPMPGTLGVYQDDFPVSRSLLNPVTTLPAVLASIGLLAAAVKWRKRFPWLAFGVLWFFGAHAMESTFLPLELYFEHRNYLAMLGPIIALVVSGWDFLSERTESRVPIAWVLLLVLFASIYSLFTVQEARIWGDPIRQAVTWSEEHPRSFRARMRPALILLGMQRPKQAAEQLHSVIADFPDRFYPYSVWMAAACDDSQVSQPPRNELLEAARKRELSYGGLDMLDRISTDIEQGKCSRWSTDDFREILLAVRNNETGGNTAFIDVLLARLFVADTRWQDALDSISSALEQRPTVNNLLLAAEVAAANDDFDLARQYIDRARSAAATSVGGIDAHIRRINMSEDIVRQLKDRAAQKESKE